ncbi:MAG TPA: bifunctional histidinol-phosphatase/imidazoleglycerol-phosphate dehydratase HisB [Gammaproteobacteria bacterium]|nr:bifunctional histidinol-phosphatase/imidazoleglycerol-phosphate dehydratase HisB [Gammaproteobacteria bacterium]
MTAKILFLDRDGTLIEEPPDNQVDALEKLRLVQGVIPALLALQDAGYQFVIVSNQDGLDTPAFPREQFEAVREHMLALFRSQGITFAAEFYCPHTSADGCGCRKPRAGLIAEFLRATDLDRSASAVIGDRETDLELAANIGLQGFRIGGPSFAETWAGVAHELLAAPRRATVRRRTRETSIQVDVDLDRAESPHAHTGIGFFDHMLEQIGKHGGFALDVSCDGDLHVDEHHTVEDVALALGEALRRALGDKRGIQRYGFVLPMDEAEAQVSVDLGGRPYFVFDGAFPRERVGELPTELVEHFFRSLAEALRAAVHVRVRGENAHHMVESAFKGLARCLRQAIARDGRDLPSTKGLL